CFYCATFLTTKLSFIVAPTQSKFLGDNELLIPSARKVATEKSRRALATHALSKYECCQMLWGFLHFELRLTFGFWI
ncbi:hypothetical protein J7L68_06020, partial [bacterium]|nr:hypothetical protein [bacterium]